MKQLIGHYEHVWVGMRREVDQEAQFCDVDYADLVADPMGVVASVYDHFGLSLTAEAESAMRSAHEASTTGAARHTHRYTLEDGLTAEEVRERFT